LNINWPSGNIQTPVSRPLEKGIDLNPFCKREDPHKKEYGNNCIPLPAAAALSNNATAIAPLLEPSKTERPGGLLADEKNIAA
jgi:hypothetical protein